MFKGGIADKLGNRYEAKWLVYKLLSVLSGDYDEIRFEGISDLYSGFEFSISNSSKTEWHQTKINAPSGNWTIRALEREKLLSAFYRRLDLSESGECHFISQDNAKSLRDLTEEARLTNSLAEFKNSVSQEKTTDFEKLTETWNCAEQKTFNYLRRIFITIQPERELSNHILLHSRHLIQSEEDIFPLLRDFMEENLNKAITTTQLKEWIKKQEGMQFKAWADSGTIREQISTATKRYLGTYIPFGLGGEILQRIQVKTVLDEIYASDGAGTLILTGVAGTGKSGVIRQIINKLHDNNITVLAFRGDHFLDSRTSLELGKSLLSRNESPVSTLKGIAPNQTSVLIIDQLDAISEVSGRDGLVRSAIFELLGEAKSYGGIKVIVACRTYDLENDDRFRSLAHEYKTEKIEIPELDWETEINPLLKKLGFQPDNLSDLQRRLLANPVNLAVFIEIDEKEFSFFSRMQLFAKLVEKKQRKLTKTKQNWSIYQPLDAIAKWMSDRQTLTAPKWVMDQYASAIDWLASENLIIMSNNQINFFHESFFDFVYARSFITEDKSVLDLLFSTEQHLFRRTQIRQIFTLMRDDDPVKYLKQLEEVFASDQVRFHLKLSVAQWLGALENPILEELEMALEMSSFSAKPDAIEYSILFQTPNWFPLLNSKALVLKNLNSENEQREYVILRWLSDIAGEYPTDISNILRLWWSSNEKRAEKLVDWFGFIRRKKPDDDLLVLCEEIIRSNPKNLFQDNGRDRIMMLLHSWVDHDPDKCGNMVSMLFEAWFAMHPDANLLAHNDFKLLDGYSLSQLAEKSPLAFIEGTTEAIFRTVKDVASNGKQGPHWYSFAYQSRSNHIYGFDGLFQLYEDCLAKTALSNVELTKAVLEKFTPSLHTNLLGLHLKVIQTNPSEFGLHLTELLDEPGLLEAGLDGAKWKAFAEAAKNVLALSSELAPVIEKRVLAVNYELDRAKRLWARIKSEGESDYLTKDSILRCFRYSGTRQWNILRVIGEENLTEQGRKRFTELNRKFCRDDIEHEEGVQMVQVRSPISQEKCALMSDQNWLGAIRKYHDDERSFVNGRRSGGARELSHILYEGSKKIPDRFLPLFLKIPLNANICYFTEILRGIREAKNPDLTLTEEILEFAYLHFKTELSEGILSVVEAHTDLILKGNLRKMVFDYAVNGELPRKEAIETDDDFSGNKILSAKDLLQSGNLMILRSTYEGRAKAWETIKRCLWEQETLFQNGWALVEKQAAEEKNVSVRRGIFEAMIPLFNDDKARYETTLRSLLDASTLPVGTHPPIAILATHEGVEMHKYIDCHLPNLSNDLIKNLLSSTSEPLQLIGTWWVFCEKFRHGRIDVKLKPLTAQSEQEKVLFASVAAQAYEWTEFKDFAGEMLLKLFADKSEVVQEKASEVFRYSKKEEFTPYIDLAEKFVETPAFVEKPSWLLYALEDVTYEVTGLVIRASGRLLESIVNRGDQFGGRASGVHTLQELLSREYASSERRPDLRNKLLNLIDYMLESEISGADRVITPNDR